MKNYTAVISGRNTISVILADSGVLSYKIHLGDIKEIQNLVVTPPTISATIIDRQGNTLLKVYDLNNGMLKYTNFVLRAPTKLPTPSKQTGSTSSSTPATKSQRLLKTPPVHNSSEIDRPETESDFNGSDFLGCCVAMPLIVGGIISSIVFTIAIYYVITDLQISFSNYMPWYCSLAIWILIIIVCLCLPFKFAEKLSDRLQKTFLGENLGMIIAIIITVGVFIYPSFLFIKSHFAKNNKANLNNTAATFTTHGVASPSVKFSPNTTVSIQGNLNQQTTVPQINQSNDANQKRIAIADAQLNSVYHQLMSKLSPDQKGNLKKAEIEWIKEKEAFIKANPNNPNEAALKAITDRTRFLQNILQNSFPR